MLRRMVSWSLLCCASLLAANLAAEEGKLAKVDKLPAGLADKVAAAVQPSGQQVVVDGAPVCTVWLAKELPVKEGFKPSLNVKYPLTTGQFVGVLEVQRKQEFTDFRGQEVAAGVYTLRYAQQPVDGNHVGTSELYDFLLAVPAKSDVDPAPLKSPEDLYKKSAASAGATHPAIYSLLPPEKETAPALRHDDAKHFWILTVIAAAPGGAKTPLRIVVVGKSEG